MSPIAGPVADRFDRRRIHPDRLSASTAAFGLLAVGSAGTLWFGFLCLRLISGLGSFVGPSARAGLPNRERSRGAEAGQPPVRFALGAMLAVGAAAGGLFASAFGRDASFIANAISFLGACFFVTLIRRPMQVRAATAEEGGRIRPIADMHGVLLRPAGPRDPRPARVEGDVRDGRRHRRLLAVLATDELNGGDGATGLLLGARGLGVAAH